MYPPSAILAAGGVPPEKAWAVTGVEDLDTVPVRPAPAWMRLLWRRGTAAMTLPWGIYVDPVRLGDRELSLLILHELVHVRQWRSFGTRRFLWTYVKDYASGRRRGLDHTAAYLGIRFEREARMAVARYIAAADMSDGGPVS